MESHESLGYYRSQPVEHCDGDVARPSMQAMAPPSSVAGQNLSLLPTTKKAKKTHNPFLPYQGWTADEIRKECTRRMLRVPSRMKKDLRIEALRHHDAAKEAAAAKLPGDRVAEATVVGDRVLLPVLPRSSIELDSDISEESLIVSRPVGEKAAEKTRATTKQAKKTHNPLLHYQDWTADQIRKECTRRRLRVPSRMNKELRIEALCRHDAAQALAAGDSVEEVIVVDPIRSKPCMFRLVNVLFSDEFALRFSRSGVIATRAELDIKSINDKSVFWQDVQAAFVAECDDDHKRNKLEFDDDELFAGVNPADAKRDLTAKKLLDMWKDLSEYYMKAQARFLPSYLSENEFRMFVRGRGDVLYLRKWLQRKANLTTFVKGGLLPRDELSTVAVPSATAAPNKRKHEAPEIVAPSFHTNVPNRRTEPTRDQSEHNLQRRSKLLELMAEVRRQLADVNKKIESCNSTERQILEEDHEILLEERKRLIERLRSTEL